MKKELFKKIAGWLHLWLGLASGLVVLVVTLTGSLLVFEKELDETFSKDFHFVEVPANGQRLAVDSLFSIARNASPGLWVERMKMFSDEPDRTVIFTATKGEDEDWIVVVNPYSGAVVKNLDESKRFFGIVEELHRRLLMGEVGKAITGVSCLIFLSLIITGLVIWWPKKIKMLKQRVKIKWDASFKRVTWDLHAVGGFYIHLIIFAIAFTGLTWSYKWFNDGIYMLFDGKKQEKYKEPSTNAGTIAPGRLESIYLTANTMLPYKGAVNMRIPEFDTVAITVSKENFEASIDNVVDFLYFDKGTAQLVKDRLYKNESRGSKARRLVLPIHSGSIYGWPTKILVLFSVLIAASLPVTGFMIWWNRTNKKKKPKPPQNRAIKKATPAPPVTV